MYTILIGLMVLLLTGCSRAWIDAGVCVDTSKFPDIDVVGKLVNNSDLVKYNLDKFSERCVKINAGNKNLSQN